MGWFDEQIRQRKQSDQELFEESILEMAAVVLGTGRARAVGDQRIVTKAAIDEILKYYHYKPEEIPESVQDPEEQLSYCLRPHGLMYRTVELSPGWYRDAYGPMIAYRKEDGMPEALLPNAFRGYYYHSGNQKIKVDRNIAEQFELEALCFYRPLPMKQIGIPDFLKYLKDCLSLSDYVLILGLTLMATLAGMVLPGITRVLTGFVVDTGSGSLLGGTALFAFCAVLASQMITSARNLWINRIQTKTSLSMEAAIMMRVLSMPAKFFKRYSAGELSSRIQSVNMLCTVLLGSVFSVGLTSVFSLLYITQFFQFAPSLVVPSLAVILATLIVSLITALMQIKVSRKSMELSAKESGMSYALISGIQKIKLSGAEKRAFSRWAKAYSPVAEVLYNPPLLLKVNGAIQTGISLAGMILIYYLAVVNRVTPSEFYAFNVSYGMLMGAFLALSGVAFSVGQVKPILDLAEPVLSTEPEAAENKEIVTHLTGSIELSNVCFRYEDNMPYVVDGMSLKIKAGEYLAIVGTTGCGKSTLMRLLLGFETPERGAIYYDGKDMCGLDLQSLRRKIGAVTQDGSLFQGDIFSNISISAPQLTLEEAWEAAEVAGMADTIRAMPMGMHTIISEGQGGISGGQKQRLMIARAVAPKPKILMFDEATSALDNKTQKQVSDALDHLKCTRIVIAHRLSTIRHCDRILVLDKGKIMEEGTYDQLIEKNGLFAELVARQRLDI